MPSIRLLLSQANTNSSALAPPRASILSYISNNFKNLNPSYWFLADPNNQSAHNIFIENQRNASTLDRRYYPFTSADPFKPWYQRLKTLMFGESELQLDQRVHDKILAWRSLKPILVFGKKGTVTTPTPIRSLSVSALHTYLYLLDYFV